MTRHFPPPKREEEASSGTPRSIRWRTAYASHWKLALIVFVMILAVGLPVAWFKGRPSWRAEGVLYVSPRVLRNLDTDPEHDLQSNSQYREFVQQQVRTITRFDIVQAAAGERSANWDRWRLSKETERRAIDRLRGSLQIQPVPDTYQVTVGLEGSKPGGLSEIVNSVMNSYVETARKELLYDAEERVKNLEDEKSNLSHSIDSLMQERTRIAQQLGTTVFSGAIVNSYDKMLGEASGALMEARRQKFVAEANVGAGDRAASANAGMAAEALEKALSDAGITSLKATLNQRKAELLVKTQGLSPQHATRIAAEEEAEQIDHEIERITREMQSRLEANIETTRRSRLAQASQVEANLGEETKKIRVQAESYSRAYQHSIELGEEIDRLRKRLNAVEDRIAYLALEAKAPGFVRVFSAALPADLPVKGGRRNLFLLVGLAACLLGLAVPVALDYFDPSVRSAGELEAHVGLPLTACFPDGAERLPREALLRAAISIRRHIEQLSRRAIVVTTLRSGSGASTVALQLGATLSRIGVRTIVVEANALTPDARYEGNATPGVIEVLRREVDLSRAVVRSSGELPDRIATGMGHAEELLRVDRVEDVVQALRKDYDLVLIDAAPIENSLATEELVRSLDAVLLVVNARRDHRKAVASCMARLERLAPHTFGAVLNQAGEHPAKKQERFSHDQAALLAA